MPGAFLAQERRRTRAPFLDPTNFSSPTNRWRADSIGAPGLVASWVDSIGGVNITAAGAARPTRGTNALNGQASVAFDGVANTLTAAAFVRAQPSTIVLVGVQTGFNVAGRYLDSGPSNVDLSQFDVPQQISAFAGGSFGGFAGSAPHNTPFYVVVHYAGASSTLQLNNGEVCAAAAIGAGGFAGAFAVGGAGGFFLHAEIQEILVYAGSLTPSQLAQMQLYVQGRYGVTRVWSHLATSTGDSIDAGFGVVAGGDWPTLTNVSLGAGWSSNAAYENVALAGNTIPDCDAQAVASIDRFPDQSFDRVVVTMGAGINDIVTSLDSLATIKANMTTFCTNRRAAAAALGVTSRFKIVIRNLISCGTAFSIPAHEAIREQWNAYIASPAGLLATGADACIDVTLDPVIGAPAAFNDATYFQAGGTHPTLAGQQRIEALAAPVLAAL